MKFQLTNSYDPDDLPEYVSKLESKYKIEKTRFNDRDYYIVTINNIVSLTDITNILGHAIIIENASIPGCDYTLEIYDGYRE